MASFNTTVRQMTEMSLFFLRWTEYRHNDWNKWRAVADLSATWYSPLHVNHSAFIATISVGVSEKQSTYWT